MNARYPAAIATDADLTVAADRILTTLVVAISASDTVLTLANAAGIVVNTLLGIDNELTLVTNLAPLTVTRGYGGTAAVGHLATSQVSGLIDAYQFNALSAEVKAIESTLGANLANVGVGASQTFSVLFAAKYNYPPIAATGSLAVGSNAIPCTIPPGLVAGGSAYISGGTGAAEVVPVTGASGGSVIVTCANTHTGAWTMHSATLGISEAIAALPATGGVVDATSYTGAQTLFGGVVIPAFTTVMLGAVALTGPATGAMFRLGGNASRLIGFGPDTTVVQSNAAAGAIVVVANTNLANFSQDHEISALTIKLLNTAGSAANGLDIYAAWYSNFRNVSVVSSGGSPLGSGIVLRDVTFNGTAQGAYGITFDRCFVGGVQTLGFASGIWLNSTSPAFSITVINLLGCWSSWNNGVGVKVGGSAAVRWVKVVGGAFDYNTSHAFDLVHSDQIWIDGCDIEGNGGWGVTGGANTAEVFINASFDNNTLGGIDAGLSTSGMLCAKIWDASDHDGLNRGEINYFGAQPRLVMQNNNFTSKILVGIDVDGETMLLSANVRPTAALAGTLIDTTAPGALFRVSSRNGISYLTTAPGTGSRALVQQWAIDTAGNQTSQTVNFFLSAGAPNAITATLTGIALVRGVRVTLRLQFTIGGGVASTFNGVPIRSSRNPSNNIAAGYAGNGIIELFYETDGPWWLDMSQ